MGAFFGSIFSLPSEEQLVSMVSKERPFLRWGFLFLSHFSLLQFQLNSNHNPFIWEWSFALDVLVEHSCENDAMRP